MHCSYHWGDVGNPSRSQVFNNCSLLIISDYWPLNKEQASLYTWHVHFSDLSPAWLATPFTVSFTGSSHPLDLIVPTSLPLILPTCPPVTLTSILRTTLSFQSSQQPHVDVKLASGTYMTLCHYLHLSPAPFPSSPAPSMGVPHHTLESSWHIFLPLCQHH